jgi:hypothetical protein
MDEVVMANLRCHINICLEGIRKTMKTFGQANQYPHHDVNPGPAKYTILESFPLYIFTWHDRNNVSSNIKEFKNLFKEELC